MINKHGGYKIMIAEDEAVIALRLEQMLERMGYDVPGIAYSGEEALEKARYLEPDLILMDILMPGELDGIDVAQMVKSELNIPVIFLTAFAEDTVIERAKKAEPFGYILKPIQDREIKAAVEVAFYKKEMEEKLRKAYDELEHQVEERTVELKNALNSVKQRESELNEHKLTLVKLNKELLETNHAVTVLAKNIDKRKEELEKKIVKICNSKLIPILKKLQQDAYCKKRKADLELLINYLSEFTHGSSLIHDMNSRLTEQEMRVMVMVKNGLTSQQIADVLCVSPYTVKTHRRNIRKKLKIDNMDINLVSYLKSKLKDQDQG